MHDPFVRVGDRAVSLNGVEGIAVKYNEAMHAALYYAFGQEDARRQKTASPFEGESGAHHFATAFASAHQALNDGKRSHVPSVQRAHARWQETGWTIEPGHCKDGYHETGCDCGMNEGD